jgi:type II secretory pathway component PulJ
MRARLLREEGGFTLTEVLVAMILMILVMFALYSIFDMSIRVFSFGNDKVEAVENARLGLSKMEREIRAAYPNNKAAATPDETLFFSPTGTNEIKFGLDLNGNHVVDHPSEEVTYNLSGTTLMRNGQPAVEFVTALNFVYQDRFGATVPYTSAEIVNIKLTVNKDGRTQELQTDVSLRNRNT